MNKQKLLILMLCGLISSISISFAQAQTKYTVKGTIVDAQQNPIIGASVVESGTTNGVSTDISGQFKLDVRSENSAIDISGLGYKQASYIANSNIFASPVVLTDENLTLDDVVVIGYGKVRKSDATGSVLSIKPDQFNKGSQVSPQQALVGKMAGVNVIPGGGAPGEGATIRIRGGASLAASNDPLIVIDGVAIDNDGIKGSSNALNTVNPNDIESFTVLKDASAAAIYGSRAANGVILITTKKGSSVGAQAPTLNYNNNFSVSVAHKRVDVLNADQYRDLIKEYYNDPTKPNAINGLGTDNTYWQDKVLRPAFGQEHNASLTGSTKNMPYRVSLGYTNQDGVVKTNNYNRTTLGLGASPRFMDNHLMFNFNVKGSYENSRNVQDPIGASVMFDPTRPIYENGYDEGLGYFMFRDASGKIVQQAATNPMSLIDLRNDQSKIYRSLGNASVDYKLHGLEDLKFNLNVAYDVVKSDGSLYVPKGAPKSWADNGDGLGDSGSSLQNKRNTQLDFGINYAKQIGKHRFDVMGGYSWQHFWNSYRDKRYSADGGKEYNNTFVSSESYLVSFYGRLNYILNDKYLLTATLRNDGSSRFSPDQRWGLFPSVALAWRINEENFLKDSQVISDLKLRASYGQTGQQDILNNYAWQQTYLVGQPDAEYMFGDEWYTTYRSQGFDKNIKWETNETYNIGVDFELFRGRLSGSLDYYIRNTKDLLNRIPVAAGTNMTNMIYTNVGSMKNSGVEFAINAVPIASKDWHWSINYNMSFSQSEITKLTMVDTPNYGVKVGGISGSTGGTAQIHSVGYAPYTFYLKQQKYDENGKPIEGQYENNGALTHGKKPSADIYYGLSSKVSYKRWDLGFNAHGSIGNYVFNNNIAKQYKDVLFNNNSYTNMTTAAYNIGFNKQQLWSDIFLEDASFFRMDNITLGYSVNKIFGTKLSARFTAAVQNVFTITNYSGIDPEVSSGIDNKLYTRPTIYMFGMNFNF